VINPIAAARSTDRDSSAATTPATAFTVDRNGRASTTSTTDHQKPGEAAARLVSVRPSVATVSSSRRRPRRSARAARCRLASDASRITASAIPIVVTGIPSWKVVSSLAVGWPRSAATSPMTTVTPNAEIPAAIDSAATASTGAVSHDRAWCSPVTRDPARRSIAGSLCGWRHADRRRPATLSEWWTPQAQS
jgi:hypothetical protein